MNDLEITETIKLALRNVCNDKSLIIEDHMSLFEDFKLDSLDFVEFVQEIEMSVGYKLDMDLFLKKSQNKNFKNLVFLDFVNYVISLKENKANG